MRVQCRRVLPEWATLGQAAIAWWRAAVGVAFVQPEVEWLPLLLCLTGEHLLMVHVRYSGAARS